MKSIFLTLLGVVLFSGCERDDDAFDKANANDNALSRLISFSKLSNTQLPADSHTACDIQVTIARNADTVFRTVTFKTDLGKFANDNMLFDAPVNASGVAVARLIGDVAGTAHITATVKTISIDTIINFTTALPDDMILTSDKYVTPAEDPPTFTVELFRNNGKVSDPVKVFFRSMPDSTDTLNMVIPPFVLSNENKAVASGQNPYSSHGWFTIEASVLSASGDTLHQSVRIRLE